MQIFVRDKRFYRTFFALTATIALQNFVAYGVNLADSLMLGSYSETALSGVAMVNQVQFLLQMLAGGVGEGVVILCSQYWGKQQTGPIRKVVGIGVRLAVIVGLVMFALAFLFPRQLLRLLTNDAAVIETGAGYLTIICFSYVLFAVTTVLLSALRSVETVRIGLILSLCTLVVNVTLNYMFIFGHGGAPELGARGAAVATLVSRILEFIVVLVYVRKIDKKIGIRFKDWLHSDKLLRGDYAKLSTPIIVSNGLWGIAMSVQTAILGHMGSTAIAANTIANTMFQVISVFGFGMTNSASVVIGKTIGERRLDMVKRYAITMQGIFLCVGAASGLLLFLAKNVIVDFYNVSPESQVMARQFMTILSISIVGSLYQNPIIGGIIRGGGDTRFSFIVDNAFMWLFTIPISCLSGFVWGFSPVITYIFLKMDQWLKCIVAVIKVNRFKWIKELTRETV